MFVIVPILVGILLATMYGILLRASVKRIFFIPSKKIHFFFFTGSSGLWFATMVRFVLFGAVAYLMLRWSVAHLILMTISFLVTLWIIMFVMYRSDYPHVGCRD